MSDENPAGFLPGRHPIDAYGEGGFKFGGMSHRGSLLALPSGLYAWEVASAGEIDEAALSRLFAEAPDTVEHLLVGTGLDLAPLKPALVQRLRALKIVAEPMATGAAARTYNILMGEGRRVAAALVAV
ncbi:MAG TPA: Mth938-like domain-containing protein [Rhodoblastus sp.]|nr:Mth938-like domain-containing protein [Rhodoblastus sp.]